MVCAVDKGLFVCSAGYLCAPRCLNGEASVMKGGWCSSSRQCMRARQYESERSKKYRPEELSLPSH